jgi:hypothetical protein
LHIFHVLMVFGLVILGKKFVVTYNSSPPLFHSPSW